MRKFILPVLALVIVSSCADVKTNVEVGANTENHINMWIDHNRQVLEKFKESKQQKVKEVEVLSAKSSPIKTASKVIKNEYEVFTLTAYTNGYESTQKHKGQEGYGITASGAHTLEGVTIAADWDVLPRGSVIYIEGLGKRIVQDRGGKINGKHIDVFFESLKDAIEFGKQKLKVKVISKPTAANEGS